MPQPEHQRFDLAVVGLGAFGSAVAYHASALGLRVVGFDRHQPPHQQGSSHTETRVTRLAVGEGTHLVPFAKRSHAIWRAIEADHHQCLGTALSLFHLTGGLFIGRPDDSVDERWGNFVHDAAAVAAATQLPFEHLSAAECRQRFPQLLVSESEAIGYDPNGGLVMIEQAIAAQLALAQHRGAELHVNCPVRAVTPDGHGVLLDTENGTFSADQVVICAGAWSPAFADPDRLRITRQVVYWFEAQDLEEWRPDRIGFGIWAGRSIEDYLGLFAAPIGTTLGVKLLSEQFVDTTTATTVDRTVSDEETASFYERLVAPRLSGVTNHCLRAEVCLYTNTVDDGFLIDSHPESEAVTVVSACSGHGFKHSTAIGEALARRAAGLDYQNLDPFRRQNRPRWIDAG